MAQKSPHTHSPLVELRSLILKMIQQHLLLKQQEVLLMQEQQQRVHRQTRQVIKMMTIQGVVAGENHLRQQQRKKQKTAVINGRVHPGVHAQKMASRQEPVIM